MGLLGDSMNDPQTLGNLALAAGLLHGDFGAGLAGFGQAYQGAQNGIVDRADKLQQIRLRDLQAQQLTRQMDWKMGLLGDLNGPAPAAGTMSGPAIPPTSGGNLGSGTYGMNIGGQQAFTPATAPGSTGGGSLVQKARALGVPDAAISTDVVFNDGKGLSDMFMKLGAPKRSFVNGVLIDENHMPVGTSVPTVSQNGQASQTIMDPSVPGGFRIIAPAGAVDTYGSYLTKQKEVDDKFAPPVTLSLPSGPRIMSPAAARNYAGGSSGGAAPAPAEPLVSPLANLPKPQAGVNGNFTGDPALVMETIGAIKDPQERSNAYAALVRQITSAANPGAPLQTSAEAKVAEARGDAAVASAKIKASTEPLLSAIDQAISINPKVPSGSFGMAEVRRDLSNIPYLGNGEAAKYAGQWDQLMGQNIMNGIASSGLGRMDIPIVNAIKAANGIPMENNPQAREQMLRTLRDLVVNHARSADNTVVNLNQPGVTTNTEATPMVGAAKPLPPNPSAKNLQIGAQYTLPGGKIGTFDGMGFKVQ